MTLTFLVNIRAEFLKTRRSAAWWLTIIGAAFIPAINVIKCAARPDFFLPALKNDPWGTYLDYNWQIAASVLLLMYIMLVTSLIVQIEYRNNAWKQVYSSPRNYADIFFSKFVVIHFQIIACFILFNLLILISAYTINWLQPAFLFFSRDIPWEKMLALTWKMYLSALAVMAIQYWLSLRFRNFVIPLGIGLGVFIVGFMIRQWEQVIYFPYMYPLLAYFKNPGLAPTTAYQVVTNSIIWFILVLSLGFWNIAGSREKG